MQQELVAQPSKDLTPSSGLSALDILPRLARFDRSVTDDECRGVIALLESDQIPAGLEYAAKAGRAITRVHPKTDVDDFQAYSMAIALIMSEYPKGVLDRVSDPRTGIIRTVKFLPRPAEVAQACDAEAARRTTILENARVMIRTRHLF
jgi:hypothetical protein